MILKKILANPITREADIDSPDFSELRQIVIRRNRFLWQIYKEWYELILSALPSGKSPILELGSGGGFLSDFIPGLITSEVFYCQHAKMVLDGRHLPFTNESLRCIVMTDVLHHLPKPGQFFAEASRCVKPLGRILMIEPWVTPWSRFVYTYLHHEPFEPESAEWSFPQTGPLSGANGAMPWMIFERDKIRFEQEFPEWHIQTIKLMMPFRYLLSGGVSMRSLMPGVSFSVWRKIEELLRFQMKNLAMFAFIVLSKKR